MSGVILQPRFRNKPVHYRAEAVGPIGDVHQIVKLKHSAPELPLRFEKTFSTARVGQNIQDGDSPSFNTGALWPRTVVSGFDRPSNVTTGGGFTHQDIIPEDRLVIADTIALPSYSWENLLAETYKANVTGNHFLPLPGAFAPAPGSVPRGGATPQIQGPGIDLFQSPGVTQQVNPEYYERVAETNTATGGVYGLPYEDAPLGGFAQGLQPGIDVLREQYLQRSRPQGFIRHA